MWQISHESLPLGKTILKYVSHRKHKKYFNIWFQSCFAVILNIITNTNLELYKNIATKSHFEKASSVYLGLPTSPRVLNIILPLTLRCMLNTSQNELTFSNSLYYLLYFYGQRENASVLPRVFIGIGCRLHGRSQHKVDLPRNL